ncbi:MAG: tetratricopeptide repeat protein [Acidobacteria bacterium]|nr:tetratricopeptide repeat protein [Acidobacteriota bacterium]MCA1619770.1 tetratricopeptide repeat protein [Acidobacteriota bacterium]
MSSNPSKLTARRPLAARALRPAARALLALLAPLVCVPASALAQSGGGIDTMGTGGSHVIQGRVFLPSGRISDARTRVLLESTHSGTLSVLTDPNGAFRFTSLMSGSYTVVVEGTEQYEAARESVYLDQTTGRTVREAPRVATVYLNLRPKRAAGTGESRPPGVLDASLADAPKAAVELYHKAVEAARKKENERAAELLRGALEFHPNFRLALSDLGALYLKMKQPERAAGPLRAALKLAPDDFPTLLNYGIALYDRKEFAEAEAQFRKAVGRNTSSPTAHFYLGVILLKRRETDEAEKELRAAVASGGGQIAVAHYYLGGIYWGRQDYKRAADELETYLRLAPDAPEAARVRSTVRELRARQ